MIIDTISVTIFRPRPISEHIKAPNLAIVTKMNTWPIAPVTPKANAYGPRLLDHLEEVVDLVEYY